jgi:hypothetical protein
MLIEDKSQQNSKIIIVPLSKNRVMGDDAIVGILGILATILGTILGFALSIIWDFIKTKRERQRCQNLLRFKLYSIREKIDDVNDYVDLFDKITDQKDLTKIQKFLFDNGTKEEISKVESITDKIVNSNYNKKERLYFAALARLKKNLNFLLTLESIPTNDSQDKKPLLNERLPQIYLDIDCLIQGEYTVFATNQKRYKTEDKTIR